MLVSLHVKNMALIREEEISFGPGLNILTGETGAGKSIIIGSVNVALGRGKFSDYVPEGTENALCELVFETHSARVIKKLEELDIPVEDGQVVISRKYQKGRSISRVNGESVPAATVRELARDLMDIHGQHEHQSLLHNSYHLDLLDRHAAADLKPLSQTYAQLFGEYRAVKGELARALTDETEQARALDLARYEMQEIDQAQLRIGEDEDLENDYRRMANGQKIAQSLSQVDALVGGDQFADSLGRAMRELGSIVEYDEALQPLMDSLSQVEELAEDFRRSLSDYLDDFSYDEQTFYEMSQRLDVINHLKDRYARTIEGILAYRDAQEQKVERLEHYESYLEELRRSEKQLYEKLCQCAGKITEVRRSHAAVLEKEITAALVDLNFLDVRFQIAFDSLKEPAAKGMDEVNFLISTNPGMPLRPLGDTASGGELSRIMLAIKAVMADQDAVETLIFDEIDTGISGRTAQRVSEKMAWIARSHQVICITHLAQIAAMAEEHYLISKAVEDGSTQTRIRLLGEEESVEELCRILGGVSITQAVRLSAGQMRQMALEYKKQLG